MRILTYHGRTLSTQFFTLTDQEVPSKVTKVLEDIRNGATVCKGLVRTKSMTNEDCLIEYFNDTVIARSLQCTFLIANDSEQCDECQRLVGLKNDVDLNHIESLPASSLTKVPKQEAIEVEPDLPALNEHFKLKEEEVEPDEFQRSYKRDPDWETDYDPAPKSMKQRHFPSLTIEIIPKQQHFQTKLVHPRPKSEV